ncbi:glycogen synthase GlgA [Parageobacillus thermoglucosidasius]|uniref:glycogen synthase GlgA n=1 Tax=Parageobacillus thermoglucosidasius TaxID=1426 RepID=UPI000E163237|nr:glycogen synthase GlgA [Parageobacillus thermoglucosidasius]MED4903642.1 glycogen synthase GlgA [Parageobacillus thermoglucosidasius]MED4912688.1 glycogen synthase GlgA [Parageobacillus thermoglucosidasius]MED4944480.1 glycogen synthase GlgA [Parageobacillus thermoglucosidasius]MED4982078.1 glycogen synthase GlgA [Parageobacillus thermoglucosidasius]RDE20424.1 glycogen synthase GlgA [Parageobacillus thermoglucosidasius]
MNVLFVVSECVPFVKSGGLADVAGALPKQLRKLGADVRVIMPKYATICENDKKEMKKIAELVVSVGWRRQYCGIEMLECEGVIYYFVDNEYYFKRHSLYGHYDDGERFAYFCRAVLDALPKISFRPDIIHCHDWHTGMIPFFLREQYRKNPFYEQIRTMFTIHNLQFQGIFPREILGDLLNLSDRYFAIEHLEFYGNVSFMKGALVAADIITTVSPTYKEEIQTEYYGERLDGLLRARRHDLIGILNGIDDEQYNPKTDPFIAAPYDMQTVARKQMNKRALQQYFGLSAREDVPVVAMVTRLTKQKGIDLVKCVFHEIIAEDVQFILLGTGDPEFEQFFRAMEATYPDKVKAYIGFNEELAHQIYAGADLFLMPSKFEPCGLSQMIALRYGTIPIVRETGGLNDTVQSYNEVTGEGNGFSFTNFNAHDMLYTIRRALAFYKEKQIWEKLMQKAMSGDYSWRQSALEYHKAYADLIAGSEHRVL